MAAAVTAAVAVAVTAAVADMVAAAAYTVACVLGGHGVCVQWLLALVGSHLVGGAARPGGGTRSTCERDVWWRWWRSMIMVMIKMMMMLIYEVARAAGVDDEVVVGSGCVVLWCWCLCWSGLRGAYRRAMVVMVIGGL